MTTLVGNISRIGSVLNQIWCRGHSLRSWALGSWRILMLRDKRVKSLSTLATSQQRFSRPSTVMMVDMRTGFTWRPRVLEKQNWAIPLTARGESVPVPQDYTEAMKWFRKAADQGDAGGQFILGQMYSLAQGVPQNDAEAVKWYRLAADQGYAAAQYGLGLSYKNGEGVPQDFAEALK